MTQRVSAGANRGTFGDAGSGGGGELVNLKVTANACREPFELSDVASGENADGFSAGEVDLELRHGLIVDLRAAGTDFNGTQFGTRPLAFFLAEGADLGVDGRYPA